MTEAAGSHHHRLEGLDGQNPLGYFAALGLLRVLDDDARATGARAPRLRFAEGAKPFAEIETTHDRDALVACVVADAKSARGARALGLRYDEDGAPCDASTPKARRDLKPSPAYAAQYLDEIAAEAAEDPRSAALAQAFISELVQDNNGNTKPTAFHFATGNQQWLKMVLELRESVTAEHIAQALYGPWKELPAPSLAWDSTVARNYALRATNPATEKRGSIPGANWLAVIGLSFFPVNAIRGRLETSGVEGGWKDSTFSWPLWSCWVSCSVARGLLRGNPLSLTSGQRKLVGISQVFASGIVRPEGSPYGSFTPADVVPPRRS